MFELKTTADELKDLLISMSCPSSRYGPLFDPIAPTFTPTGEATLITKDKGTFQQTKFQNLQISGIDTPTKIPIRASRILSYLDLYAPSDEILFTFDDKNKVNQIIDLEDGIKDDVTIPSISLNEVSTTFDTLPIILDDEGNPLFKKGTVKPDISVTLDVTILQSQLKKADKVKVDPRIFYLEFLDDTKIMTRVGDPNLRDRDSIKSISEVVSLSKPATMCKCAYALGFEEIISNLTGPIDLLTLNGGPLWITFETSNQKSNYLIAPAAL